LRRKAGETTPGPDEEVCCDLTDLAQIHQALTTFTRQQGITINGVACFDCESLSIAAHLAQDVSAGFPSPAAVSNCRDKMISKALWRRNGLRTPRVTPVRQAEEALAFFRESGGDCVLKPVSGSGSELVFRCRTEADCRRAFALLSDGLSRRADNRLYRDASVASGSVIAEEFIDAAEYSCDFLLENNRAVLIRLSRKISAPADAPFGTTRGYVLIDALPGVDPQALTHALARGATALGLTRSICMTDFMIRQGEIILLEITPRPGGDCLPALIRHALGLDVLVLTLDLAQNRPLRLDSLPPPKPLAGLRVHAERGGILKKINWDALADDPRIKEICPLRQPGDTIRMPPEDYESFLLGNIIFAPDEKGDVSDECRHILTRLTVEMES
jgi:biotin carboxylase